MFTVGNAGQFVLDTDIQHTAFQGLQESILCVCVCMDRNMGATKSLKCKCIKELMH